MILACVVHFGNLGPVNCSAVVSMVTDMALARLFEQPGLREKAYGVRWNEGCRESRCWMGRTVAFASVQARLCHANSAVVSSCIPKLSIETPRTQKPLNDLCEFDSLQQQASKPVAG